ncbi:MAG: septum formation family protein [Gulosibacter sp.]|uniref:septum formation family protein n=1 Tax=Gulosibacter sp. TaxID=2817531 RepID=UPI003F91B894
MAVEQSRSRQGSPLVRNLVIAVVVVLAAGVAGWFWSPFGRPPAPSAVTEATTAPTQSPVTTLSAGDCFETLDSPWQASFVPVSCEESHTAQLTAIIDVNSVLGDGSTVDAAWPGEEALREHAMLACQSPEALDLEAAASIPDLQVEVRWPATQAEWDGGLHAYHCFVTSSEQFGSLQP